MFVLLVIYVFDIYLKNWFFESCFQQSAKAKMTALTVRSYHVFVKLCILDCILPSKLQSSTSDPVCVFSFQLIHFAGSTFSVYTRNGIHRIHGIDPVSCSSFLDKSTPMGSPSDTANAPPRAIHKGGYYYEMRSKFIHKLK